MKRNRVLALAVLAVLAVLVVTAFFATRSPQNFTPSVAPNEGHGRPP